MKTLSKWDFALMEKTQVHQGYYQVVTTILFNSKQDGWSFIEKMVEAYNEKYNKQ